MFDIGWTELLVIGVVALVVIGPKDLPIAIKAVGKWVGKARVAAREFQDTFDEMVREAELDQARKQLQSLSDLPGEIEKKFADTTKELSNPLESIMGDKPSEHAPAPVAPAPAEAAPSVGSEHPAVTEPPTPATASEPGKTPTP